MTIFFLSAEGKVIAAGMSGPLHTHWLFPVFHSFWKIKEMLKEPANLEHDRRYSFYR